MKRRKQVTSSQRQPPGGGSCRQRRALASILFAGAIIAAIDLPHGRAQPATIITTGPATTRIALPPGPLRFIVTAVQGRAQVRLPGEEGWRAAELDMELLEGTECRTAHKSALQIAILPDQVVTLDRLSKIRLVRAELEKTGTVITYIGLETGRVRYDIEAEGRKHEATIRSPSSTLAVRGTQFIAYDQPPFAPQGISLRGRVSFADARKRVNFGGKGKAKITTDVNSAAQLAFNATYVDPSLPGARSPAEQELLTQIQERGGVVTFDPGAGINVVRGGIPLTPQEVAAAPPGRLNFGLFWLGDTDLNLSVAIPELNELVSPVSPLNLSPSGGRTAFDHRGGSNGGFEVVFFPPDFPKLDAPPGQGLDYFPIIDFVSGQTTQVELTDIFEGQIVLRRRSVIGADQPADFGPNSIVPNDAPNLGTTSAVPAARHKNKKR